MAERILPTFALSALTSTSGKAVNARMEALEQASKQWFLDDAHARPLPAADGGAQVQ